MNIKDLLVISYGSKFAIRFQTGPNLKLYNTQELAVEAAWVQAKKHESIVWIEMIINNSRSEGDDTYCYAMTRKKFKGSRS